MKLDSTRTESFIKAPTLSLALLYGPDSGLVAERGLSLARSIPGALHDPFRFVELISPAADVLLAEVFAASLTGERRVVRVREATESIVKALETIEKTPPEALLIIEAGELTPKSKLRALAEKSPLIACMACYAIDQARLPQVIISRLRAQGLTIEPDAATWAARNLTGEEGLLAQALEVLALYAGETRHLSLEDVSSVLADGGETSASDAIDATLTGDLAAADKALSLAYEEGASPVGLIRVLLSELLRLRLALGVVKDGASVQEAITKLRPPVFFKRQPVVQKMLRIWSLKTIDQALEAVLAAEAACKTTVIPEQDYCRHTMLALAMRAHNAAKL